MHHYRGALEVGHPVFPPGSNAGFVAVDERTRRGDSSPIVYSHEDDKTIAAFIMDHVGTAWHSLGTCAMKPRAEGGVVDGRLDVFGVEGLKVVGEYRAPPPPPIIAARCKVAKCEVLMNEWNNRSVHLPVQHGCQHVRHSSGRGPQGSCHHSGGAGPTYYS
jgi:hypothetical protein